MQCTFNPFNQYDRNYVVRILELTAGMVASHEQPANQIAGNSPPPVLPLNTAQVPGQSALQPSVDPETGEITGMRAGTGTLAMDGAPSTAAATPSPSALAAQPGGLPVPPSDSTPSAQTGQAPAPAPTGSPSAGPRVYASDVEVDKANLPWDARIHSNPPSIKKGDGCWRQKRETPAELLATVTAELRDAGWRAPNAADAPAPSGVPAPSGIPAPSGVPAPQSLPQPPASDAPPPVDEDDDDVPPVTGIPVPPTDVPAGLPQPPAAETPPPAAVVNAPVAAATASGVPADFKTFMARYTTGMNASGGAVPPDTLLTLCQALDLTNSVQLALPINKPKIAEVWGLLQDSFPGHFA